MLLLVLCCCWYCVVVANVDVVGDDCDVRVVVVGDGDVERLIISFSLLSLMCVLMS